MITVGDRVKIIAPSYPDDGAEGVVTKAARTMGDDGTTVYHVRFAELVPGSCGYWDAWDNDNRPVLVYGHLAGGIYVEGQLKLVEAAAAQPVS